MQCLLIDTRSATPVYIQILEQLRTRVFSGSLAAGDALPSVRQLAVELRVNPNTVAKAYMLLEREGVIETVRRRGTFVAREARAKARERTTQHLDQVARRFVEEARRAGLDPAGLLAAFKRRLEQEDAGGKHDGGESS